MIMKREKFTFYGSWWDAVGHLSGELRGEVLTSIVEYGLFGETNSARGSVTKAILELVKPQIDRDRNLYENGCQGGRPKNQTETKPEPNENQGETKAKPRQNQTETKAEPDETKPEPNENQGETKAKPRQNQTETKAEPDETKPEPSPTRARVYSLSLSCDNIKNNISLEKEESKEIGGAGGKRKRKAVRRFVIPTVEEVQAYCAERGNGLDARQFVDFYESKGWMVGRNPMKDWKAAVRTWEQRDDFRAARQPSRQQRPTQADIYAENERIRAEIMQRLDRHGDTGEDEKDA